jgi:hypothetical protein
VLNEELYLSFKNEFEKFGDLANKFSLAKEFEIIDKPLFLLFDHGTEKFCGDIISF